MNGKCDTEVRTLIGLRKDTLQNLRKELRDWKMTVEAKMCWIAIRNTPAYVELNAE